MDKQMDGRMDKQSNLLTKNGECYGWTNRSEYEPMDQKTNAVIVELNNCPTSAVKYRLYRVACLDVLRIFFKTKFLSPYSQVDNTKVDFGSS